MERRDDHVTGKRMLRAALAVAAAMLGTGGCIVWALFAARNGVANAWASFAAFVCFLAVIAAAGNLFRLMWFYRCPRCRARLARAPARPGDRILYVCPTCNVEWDTGWKVATRSAGM
jgi:hypothetical protein